MPLDRVELKRAARASVSAGGAAVKRVTLAYIALTSLLTAVVNQLISNPANEMAGLLEQGINPNYVLQYILSGEGLTLFIFVTVLLSLYTTVMQVGYIGYAMRLARNRGGDYADLMSGFAFAGRIIGVVVMVFIYTMLWSFAVVIPVMALMVLVMDSMALMLALYGAAVALVVGITLRYVLALYALADDPELGVFGAINKSKRLMRNNKLSYVVLILSFLGWGILSGLLSGLGAWIGGAFGGGIMGAVLGIVIALPLDVWLVPYMECAHVNFYDALQGGGRTELSDVPGNDGSACRDDPWNT